MPTGKLQKKVKNEKTDLIRIGLIMLIHPSIQIFKVKFHFFISISNFVSILFEFTSKDVKKYLLAISSFGRHMQEDMDIYITRIDILPAFVESFTLS